MSFALAAPASADEPGVVTDRPLAGPTSARDVRQYWTAKRMREATPVDTETSAGAGSASVARDAPAAGAAAVEQPSTTELPFRAIGRAFYTQPGEGDFVCSGAVVNTDTDSFVLTAAHCVEDGGEFATNWMFAPGYRDGASPFGEWVATELSALPFGFELGEDQGSAIVTGPGGQRIEDAVGALGTALFESLNQGWSAYGYPAESPFDGERLFGCSGSVLVDFGFAFGITCDMTAGASGGPWLVRDLLVSAVSSFRADEFPSLLFGQPLDGVADELIYAAHPAKCRGSRPTIIGTEEDDRLVGTKRRDVILADRGADVVVGKGRKDKLCGEQGRDVLRGGKGKDLCDGGSGKDKGPKCEKRKRL